MIERHWKGIAKKEKANNYIDHLQNETFPQLEIIGGFISASILKREVTEGIEFLIVSQWANIETIAKFAGSDITVAVVPTIVQQMMIAYDETVCHYETCYKTTGSL